MDIQKARKEVFEHLKMCGVGQTPFQMSLQAIYDETLRLESKLNIKQAELNIMKENYTEFFTFMNEKFPEETNSFYQQAINKTRNIKTNP